jgi:hypothetical protein
MKAVPLRLQRGDDLPRAQETWMNEKFRRCRHDNVWRLGLGWKELEVQ